MAVSIISKLRTAALGIIHDLADKAYTTPSAYKQSIRDLEKAMADLSSAKDEAVGAMSGLDRQIGLIENDISSKQATILLFLSDDDGDNDRFVVDLQMQVNQLQEDLGTVQEAKAETQTIIDQYMVAIKTGYATRDRMARDLRNLEMKAKTAAAKNEAADAIEAVKGVLGTTGSIDGIGQKIQADADKASARFDRVVSEMTAPETPEQVAARVRARAEIEELKKQLEADE